MSQLFVPKWPFFLGDAYLVGLAGFIYSESRLPLGHWELAACAICVALGALLGVLPFLLDYRALTKFVEADALGAVAHKIQDLEILAGQISSATSQWTDVHLQAEKTANTAREITERMAAEVRDFTTFMQKINEGEKATLRLEVEKLGRAEGNWLQVLVHVLDYVYELHANAARSDQPRLAEQLGVFQNACRDTARRVGLVAFTPAPGESYDVKRHKSADTDAPSANSVVAAALAPGYTLQGRLVRPALVSLTIGQNPETASDRLSASDGNPNRVPLESSPST